MMQQITFRDPQISRFQLSYFGGDADQHRLNMYDAAGSFYGFSRTIAVLGHFYATGAINAHAPRSELQVFLETSEDGSFKQNIAAAALSAVITAPFTVLVTRAIDSWIPVEDKQTQVIIELLQEQNQILRGAGPAHEVAREDKAREAHIEEVDTFLEENSDKIDVIRSITSTSFKNIFRPVGRSARFVGISSGERREPIGAVNERALRLIQADRPDDDTVILLATVNSFSRSSKTGVVFSRDIGRGFRFEYVSSEKLPPEDVFSWSQFYQRPIKITGRFVKFYDGKIKKLLVYSAEKPEDE